MSTFAYPLDRLVGGCSYLPRIGTHDGRAIEQALMGATLLEPGVSLRGAITEATFAAGGPELLQRLRTTNVPYVIDPQSLRFAGEGYLDVARVRNLEFAPEAPIDPLSFDEAAARGLTTKTLRFEQRVGASAYTAPGLPVPDKSRTAWIDANRRVLEAACSANGSGELERRPLIAQVAPGRRMSRQPERFLDWLVDLPVDAVYVQALNLHPTNDSAEKLATYIDFVKAFVDRHLPVIVGRVGAFGLVLQSLGVSAFDSGLGDAETFALASLLRRKKRAASKDSAKGGRDRRIYIEGLKTTLQSKHAEAILSQRGLRARFVCNLGCCQFGNLDDLPERRRQHYLWTRTHEVNALAGMPEPMRVVHVHEQLGTAREHARAVRRVLREVDGPVPDFSHLDRWIGLLARAVQAPTVEDMREKTQDD